MCDLWGDWVPKLWQLNVLEVVKENPQHTFMFLTKNPTGYQFTKDPPLNCMFGLTMTKWDMIDYLMFVWSSRISDRLFLSIEPILGSFKEAVLNPLSLVIVGAMTGKGAVKPEKEWIESLKGKHPNIHFKNNLRIKT